VSDFKAVGVNGGGGRAPPGKRRSVGPSPGVVGCLPWMALRLRHTQHRPKPGLSMPAYCAFNDT
jgi:hypothetical protein